MQGESSHVAARAKRRLLRLVSIALAVAGTGAIAEPVAHQGAAAPAHLEPAAERAAPVEAQVAQRLVWQGADIDHDGQPDFANPTGQDTRKTDIYGCGEFGASRDGGARRHEGVDYMADAGQPLVAPISGYVTKIGDAYPGDPVLKFVEITNPALRYAARVFYIDPAVQLGQPVHLGQAIGVHHSLDRRYPGGMTDHVHLEILDTRGQRVDATRLITARYAPAVAPAHG